MSDLRADLFAGNFRSELARRHLYNYEFADLIDCHPQSVVWWMSGKVLPSVPKLLEISKALGRPVEWFFEQH